MAPRLLFVGGVDHNLRIPFFLSLQERGFDVVAASPGHEDAFARAGVAHRPFAFERFVAPLADWRAAGRLRALIGELRPRIVQAFDTKPNLLAPLAVSRGAATQVVRTINGLGWLYSSRSPVALALRPPFRALHRLAARATAATVFQNGDDRDQFAREHLFRAGSDVVIPGSGIDVAGFMARAEAGPGARALRDSLELGDCEVVVTVTRMTRQKGIPTLLAAARLVHARRPNVRFLLVGPRESEGPLAVSQEEIDRCAPFVIATGARTDVPALLRMADVCAFPTEYREGVPRALLEAATAGLPIVATDMPGCRDVVRHEWSGLLAPPRSPDKLARHIVRLLDDRAGAAAMAARARDLVARDFGLELTIDRYVALYHALLEHAGDGRGRGATGVGQAPLQASRDRR